MTTTKHADSLATEPDPHISDQRIDEFIDLYVAAGGERLSRDEARTKATRLLKLYLHLARKLGREAADAIIGAGEDPLHNQSNHEAGYSA